MTVKELIQELNKHYENLEIAIAIDNTEENRLEVIQCGDKVYILKNSKIRIDELENRIKKMEFHNCITSLNSLIQRR